MFSIMGTQPNLPAESHRIYLAILFEDDPPGITRPNSPVAAVINLVNVLHIRLSDL
jgi:hypothetical protein